MMLKQGLWDSAVGLLETEKAFRNSMEVFDVHMVVVWLRTP